LWFHLRYYRIAPESTEKKTRNIWSRDRNSNPGYSELEAGE